MSAKIGEGIAVLLIVSFTAAFVLSSIAVTYGLLRWAFGG